MLGRWPKVTFAEEYERYVPYRMTSCEITYCQRRSSLCWVLSCCACELRRMGRDDFVFMAKYIPANEQGLCCNLRGNSGGSWVW